ncbi:MAG: DUF4266 domain-containing protein [Verrucomicrobia bacterium]|jgi:hypothetical protein|nr:DUF4266 domain-containing protein [Verrucomicrobiota bacterium]MBT7066864.1 DUF4266 domain-containing protein [Verrucomicrobiota bacterium]MBT7701599.1 DUF4266 domain-containing protein [Verrucomicrobiota bacterium]
MKYVMLIVTAGTLCLVGVGCRSVAVYEKARLQDGLMKYEESAQESHFYQKVYYSREGSVGGMGSSAGGGCGCY